MLLSQIKGFLAVIKKSSVGLQSKIMRYEFESEFLSAN